MRRGWIYVLGYLVSPLALLFLIFIISKGSLLDYAIVGGLLSVVAENGLISLSDFAFLRMELHLQDLLVTTGIGPQEYILGLVLSNLIFSLPGLFLYSALAILYHVVNLLGLLILLGISALLLVTTSGLGFLIASYLPHVRYSWGISSILPVLFITIPPVFYPYFVLKSWEVMILSIIPTTSASILSQGIAGLAETKDIFILPLLVETAIFYVLSIKKSRWSQI
ncbi:ABC transporter permease [Sulfuracidifex tepidarius]|uniref:ABC-2 type transporter domain-containing protein n=1 Tax=Sulfuracidifex tepidarius TaxID=1294262 RepID=A0A510DZ27_9CREN|nr:ABC transporter permease [Sulfuracidifex tepidarius]BBG25437.1 hypothetical protein IC006_2773 [Sulfuracidifex tepidarius]BBG28231.1 hypothetical protein IC007_2787 [Sulfuracidifex tepidarius]